MIGFCDKWLSSFCSWYRMVSKNVIKDIMVRPLGSRRASGIVMRLVKKPSFGGGDGLLKEQSFHWLVESTLH